MKQFKLVIKLTKCMLYLPANPLRKYNNTLREIVSYLLQRLWSLGSLMASWKQNIKLGSIRSTTSGIECGGKVGYSFDVKFFARLSLSTFLVEQSEAYQHSTR